MKELYELHLKNLLDNGKINKGEYSLLLISDNKLNKFIKKYDSNEKFRKEIDQLNHFTSRNETIERLLILDDDTEIIYEENTKDDIDTFFDDFDF